MGEQQRHDQVVSDVKQTHTYLPIAPALPSLATPSEGLTTGGGLALPAPGEPAMQQARVSQPLQAQPSGGDLHAAITSAPPASPIRR